MRNDSPRTRLNIITRPTVSRMHASIRTCKQDLAASLFAEPVTAHAVERSLEVVKDDCVAETFEDER